VNVADSRKIALDYLKENKVTFPIILDISPAARKAMGQYLALPDLGADPMTYVIGRDGKIVDGWFGYYGRRTQAALEKLGLAPATAAQGEDLVGAGIVGVGMMLQPHELGRPVKVGTVLPGGPAAKAGIKPGSLILSIDGGRTDDKSLSECVSLIRGALHTRVSLEMVDPELGETNKVDLTREAISIPDPPKSP